LARERQRKNRDATLLAIAKATIGDFAEAKQMARAAAESDETASEFYSDNGVAHVFLSEEFADLQREFPVELPYKLASTAAVFLSNGTPQLEATEIAAAIRELGIETTVPLEPLAMADNNIQRAFVLRFDGGSVWFVAGNGKFNSNWTLDNAQVPIAAKVNGSDGWLAIGSAGWTESNRTKVAGLAQQLAGKLASDQFTVLCAPGQRSWGGFLAHEATLAQDAAWQSSINRRAFESGGVSLPSSNWQEGVEANRNFIRSLYDAVHRYESSPQRRLEVWAYVSTDPAIDPVRLQVSTVRRTSGSLEFDGTLLNQSLLVSELKPGLSAKLYQYEIRAFRLDDADPVYRP
jgi:hypothetical protein